MGSLLASLLEQGHFFLTPRQAIRAGSVSPSRTRGTVAHESAGAYVLAVHGLSLLFCPCLPLMLSFHSAHLSPCKGTSGEHSHELYIATCNQMEIPFLVAEH